MPEYCSTDDLHNRLTQVGLNYVADRDGDGEMSDVEEGDFITPAIQYAGNIIDGYLAGQVEVGAARGSGNAWLRDRAIDIAVYQAAICGGGQATKSIEDLKDFSLSQLQRVTEGMRIPGYAYPSPVNSAYVNHAPKVANFGGGRGRRRNRSHWPH